MDLVIIVLLLFVFLDIIIAIVALAWYMAEQFIKWLFK